MNEQVGSAGTGNQKVSAKGCAVVLGATSPIAESFCRLAGEQGYAVLVAARDLAAAEAIANDVKIRTEQSTVAASFDARDHASISRVFTRAEAELGPVTLVLVAFGDMGSAQELEAGSEEYLANVSRVLDVNFSGAAISCEVATAALERAVGTRGATPTLVGIASVAGDRGRQSNYPYGSAKGGFALYLQGLRNRMFKRGVHVVTAKFGFIDTPMTHGLKTAIPIASPQSAATALLKAASKGRDVFYFPFFWRFVMLVIRSIPERLFKRLSL